MITPQIQICSFCYQPLGNPNPEHRCPRILYSLTNTIAEAKKDSPALLGNIKNLVFQGGGIKGLAYFGSLQQLQIEGQKEGKDFLSGIQRIAGTSAGSLVALYLGLNLDLKKIMGLLQINFANLLDNSLVLKVAVDYGPWWEHIIVGYTYKNYATGDIIRAAMNYIKDIGKRLASSDQKVEEQAEKDLGDLVKGVTEYFSTKFEGIIVSEVVKWIAEKVAPYATEWLLKALKPPIEPQDSKKQLFKSGLNTSDSPSRFEEIVERECEKAAIEAKKGREEVVDVNGKPKLLSAGVGKEVRQVAFQENAKEDLKPAPVKPKQESSVEADASEYLLRRTKDIKPDPASELEGTKLYSALGEVVWFIILSHRNAEGIQQKLGLFDGSDLKNQLIEAPIVEAVGKLHPDPANITFQELWELSSQLPAEKKFKNFYVTSFNMETLRTEVFSVDHTPNAVVADAVRASISIPMFFTPVTIRERTDSGLTERKVYSSHGDEIIVHYMDGGVLDNYPIWIFDDFGYCVQDIPEFKPRMKHAMQNPRTLGFRLMDPRIIKIYTDPYCDKEKKKMKTINEKEDRETFFYEIGLLLNTEVNYTQENEYIKRGDCARTAYVDNLGMNAIQFVLTEAERKKLIQAGADSVLNYRERAAKNGFIGEIEPYPHIRPVASK